MSQVMDTFLEAGNKKVFAVSVHWPGWARFAKDEETALQKLLKYAPRYAVVPGYAGLDFPQPQKVTEFNITQRLKGNKSTDFGAPAMLIDKDWEEVDEQELARLKAIMGACWRYFDEVVASAVDKELQKGLRGGGRELEKIVNHVVEAEEAYLKKLGASWKKIKDEPIEDKQARLREEAFNNLGLSAAGEFPRVGPRGGHTLAGAVLRASAGLARDRPYLGD